MSAQDFFIFIISFISFLLTFWHLSRRSQDKESTAILYERLRKINLALNENQTFSSGNFYLDKFLQNLNITAYISKFDKQTLDPIRQWLVKAGYRSHQALALFFVIKIVVCLILGIATFITIMIGFDQALPFILKINLSMVFGLSGHALVNNIVERIIQSRYEEIKSGLPDMLELMVICINAGMSFDRSLNRAAIELKPSYPTLSEELTITVAELNIFSQRDQVWASLCRRVEVDQVMTIASSIMQATSYGTPLAPTLQNLALDYRKQKMAAAEYKAGKITAMMTLPLVMFILPTLFIVILGPIVLQALRN